jgi:perosamine synthetase
MAMTPSVAARIPVSAPWLSDRVREYVLDCVDSGWISSLGSYVDRFEHSFAGFCDTSYGVAASSGTTALHLALAALDLGPGDEVLVPDLTFVATANAVCYTGATPVLVDLDPRTWTIDLEDARRKLTPRTKALIVVHLYGHPADLDAAVALSRDHGLALIEDAAQAHGARYKGRRVGGIGDLGVFSFYGNKIITTGEGGMVVTNDRRLADRARSLRGHAMDLKRRYYHHEVGFNYRMTNVQAAIGCAQLEEADSILARRRALAASYHAGLAGLQGIDTPPAEPWAENVHWMYSIVIRPEFGLGRDAVMTELDAQGIETRPFFVPLHDLPAFSSTGTFPVSTGLGYSGINLPSGTGLLPDQIDSVCQALHALAGAQRSVRSASR